MPAKTPMFSKVISTRSPGVAAVLSLISCLFIQQPILASESNLPNCVGNHWILSKWDNCVGRAGSILGDYYGGFKDNKSHGYGVFKYYNGNSYEGFWDNDKMHGKGSLSLNNGYKYSGDFVQGKFEGQGLLVLPTGARYIGQFKAGMFHGLGAMYAASGSIEKAGVWNDDVFVRAQTANNPYTSPTAFLVTAPASNLMPSAPVEDRVVPSSPAVTVAASTARQEESSRQRDTIAQVAEDQKRVNAAASAAEAPRPLDTGRPALPVSPLAGRKALIIGNDGYRSVGQLRNARSDAAAIGRALGDLGYSVTAHYDLSERDMKQALREFIRKVNGGDDVVFFFAGHGVQIGTSNYLLPVDVRADDPVAVRDESIPLQRVLDDFSDARARFTLAIIDACRDNPFAASSRNLVKRGLAPTAAASGQMIMFSAGVGQQALDNLGPNDRSPHGLFTRVLLNHIYSKGLSVDRLLRQVRTEVVQMAKSIGHEQVPALYDQVIGDFYFLR